MQGNPGLRETPAELPPTKRRWTIRRWLLVTGGLWLAAAIALLIDGRRHALDAQDGLDDLIGFEDVASLDLTSATEQLTVARSDLDRARSSLSNPLLWPLRPLPVLGRQLASARALVTTTGDVTDLLLPLIVEARDVRADPTAVDRVDFLDRMAGQLGALENALDAADLGPRDHLLGSLATARFDLDEQLRELRPRVTDSRLVAEGLAAFLSSDRYLLLGANNAEMRMLTGMPLSIGELDIRGGAFQMSGIEPTHDLVPVRGAEVVDADVEDRWGFLGLSDDYRKLGYSARFDDYVGPQAIEMWTAQTGRAVDGVLLVDPFVIEALLGLTGDVEVDGTVFREDDVLDFLLEGQYVGLESKEEGDERRDRLSVLAAAVADAFLETSWDPLELLDAFEPLARGRHLVAYSPDPVQQAAWTQLGVDGSVDGDELSVFVLNTGASKLDPHLRIDIDARSEALETGHRVVLEVAVRNRGNERLPRYVLGTHRGLGVEPGTYSGRIGVVAPGTTTALEITGGDPGDAELAVLGPDGAVVVAATRNLSIGPGATKTFTIELEIARLESIEILASARHPASKWTWGERTFRDGLSRVWSLTED